MTTSTSFPTLAEFLTAVHGFTPHAWQVELERSLRETGQWPWHVAVPTGLGKTTSIDIAVYELARQCHVGGPRTAPQRIFHVVDRRRIIDSTVAHAALLAERVNGAVSGPLKVVKNALAQLCSEGDDLVVAVSSIHGERPDDRVWMRATGCSIVSLTAHQYVSRLLLRGHGVSPGTRSIPAGLCGIDSLVLFDEPHLSAQSVHTILRVQQLQARASEDLDIPPLRTVLLGATVPSALTALGDGDRGTLIVDRAAETGHAAVERLAARRTGFVQWVKPADSEVKKALVAAAKNAWKRNAQRIVVFANTVETAQEVYRDLARQRKAESSPVVLLTSHFRPFDRTGLDGDLSEGPRTVVATQTLEVGVDLTFDELITEVPSWASLTQRLGRLNRDGTSNDHGRATIVAGWDDEADGPVVRKGSAAVYGESTVKSATRLLRRQHLSTEGQGIDMGFDGLRAIAASDDFDAMALEGEPARIATLTSSHLPLLTQTRPVPDPDIPVDALISGPDAEQAREVAIAWREELSVFDAPNAPRVDPTEYVTIRRHRFDTFLAKLQWNPARRGNASKSPVQIRIWNPEQECWTIPRTRAEARSAPLIVMSSSLGGYAPEFGWTGDPENAMRLDISIGAAMRALREANTRGFLHAPVDMVLTRSVWSRATDDGFPWFLGGIETDDLQEAFSQTESVAAEDDDEDLELLEDAARTLAARIAERCKGPESVDEHIESAEPDNNIPGGDLQIMSSSRRAVAVRFPRGTKANASSVQLLEAHQKQVAAWADADATAAGLPQEIADVLLLAGLHHDDGKQRPEWQKYVGGSGPAPLARSGRRRSAQEEAARRQTCGLEDGWRHEAASVRLLGPVPALLGHLVGSHHGWYRPILPPIRPVGQSDREYPRVLDHAEQFAELNHRFGIWGMAYLEAVLRLADWRAAGSAVDCTPRVVSVRDLALDPVSKGASSEVPNVHRLEGLRTHPLTGWYAAVGLLVAARTKDPEAAIHWEPLGGVSGSPVTPVLTARASLEDLVSEVLYDPQWTRAQELAESHGFGRRGLGVKNQKLKPAVRLHALLLDADDAEVDLVTGTASDLGPTEAGAVTMPITPIANNSSYPEMALKMVTGRGKPAQEAVGNVCAALLSITEGFSDEKCDGGMDRPETTNPGVNGLGNPMIGQIRTVFAPLVMYGISMLGSGPVDGLGVTRSGELTLPLPTTPVRLSELRTAAHIGRARPTWAWDVDGLGWVYVARPVKLTAYEKLWLGQPRQRGASRT